MDQLPGRAVNVPEYDSLFFVVWSLAWSKARVAGGSRARVVIRQLITEEQFQDQDCFQDVV